MSLLVDMHLYLADNGQGNGLWEGRLPDDDEDVVALYGYAGRSPIYVMSTDDDTGEPYMSVRERPGLQVQSRSKNSAAAETRIYQVANILQRIVNQTINGVWYVRVELISSPYQLRTDEQDRAIWAANFATEKEFPDG